MYRAVLITIFITVSFGILHSCTEKETFTVAGETVHVNGRDIPVANFQPDMVRLKLSEDLADELGLTTDSLGNLVSTKVGALNLSIESLGIYRMQRTFPYAGRFEARTRAEGLHLWYDVYFDRNASLTKAGEELSAIDGIEIIEYRPQIRRIGSLEVREIDPEPGVSSSAAGVFDDPGLPNQWHYYNDGSRNNSVAGCDINVIHVWKNFTTGNGDVIVSVVDGGVDYTHEDLADNMWRNPEQSGDRVYGWNFVNGGPLVTADDHGTHVAGTIAAVNNNGKGVSGIAGGDKANGIPGVKIMSCQIFQGEDSGPGAAAIKWGADHGAVISQNSWGYKFETLADAMAYQTSQSDKDAIDYFIKYAGFDENGKQTGPMAGGVVIFAAGNDGWGIGHPGDYESCIAVGSVGADYRAAYYTNYGTWVDIAAPGGDVKKGNQVYSTLPGNKYGYMQGTSMACPHVSGIAALIISKDGGQGFTSKALRQRLLTSVNDISQFNSIEIGGLVDAYKSVVGSSGKPPLQISNFKAAAASNNIAFSLTVPSDPDDGKPNMIYIYYSTGEITSSNYTEFPYETYLVQDLEPGDVLSGDFFVPEFETDYSLLAVASDYGGNKSEPTPSVQVSVGVNNPPVIEPVSGTAINIKAWQSAELDFIVTDPDGHEMTPSVDRDTAGIAFYWTADTLHVKIDGKKITPGRHAASLVVSDSYGKLSSLEFFYTVEKNNAPVLIKGFEDVVFSDLGETLKMDLREYFQDPDGEQLSYTCSVSSYDIANVAFRGENMLLTSLTQGTMNVEVIASDAFGEYVSSVFDVLVRISDHLFDIYPNPVSDTLRISSSKQMEISVEIHSVSGALVYREADVSVSPFDIMKVDMASLPGGIYTLRIYYVDENSNRQYFSAKVSKR